MTFKIGFSSLSRSCMAAILVQGCSQFAPKAPDMPTASDLLTLQTEVAQLDKMDRGELVKLGYAYADERCDKFFIELQIARNKNSYEAAELAAFSAFAIPGMTLLNAGAKAVGIVGGLFAFGTASYLNYGQIMLLMQYNSELQDLVQSAMLTYKQQMNG